jgi:hypothetical protein
MKRYIQYINFILIICIIITNIYIIYLIKNIIYISSNNEKNTIGRYQYYKANTYNQVILDTKTGKLWSKFILDTGGNENWEQDIELEKKIDK